MLTPEQLVSDDLAPGDIVRGVQGPYRVVKYVGQGVTSVVYEAMTDDVPSTEGNPIVLKILRSDASAQSKSSFSMERTVLAELRRAEIAVKDGLENIPLVYESYSGPDGQFLAMELVLGEPLDRTLDREDHLNEQHALAIADQVLRVLDLLHTHARRTYTDLQMQNIWWRAADGTEPYAVKVMDWNHVSYQFGEAQDLTSAVVQGDLTRFGAYLYRMLTGKGASEQGETERALERRAGSRWEELSLGARRILLCALHPNPTRRFPSAAVFRASVKDLRLAWSKGWSDLDADLDHALGKLEKNFSRELAASVEVRLDVFERNYAANDRAVKEAVDFRRRLMEILEPYVSKPDKESADAWQAGMYFYRADQYEEAGKRWREQAQGSGRLNQWRWVMLAAVGQDQKRTFQNWKTDLEQAVEHLDNENWADAYTTFANASRQIRCAGVEALYGEVRARKAIAEARRQEVTDSVDDWRAAANSYRSAELALASVPYQEALRNEFGWQNLNTQAQQLDNRADQRSAAEKEIRKLLATAEAGDFDARLVAIEEALRQEPRNPPVVEMCFNLARREYESNRHARAVALLDLALLYGQSPDWNERLRKLRSEASRAAEQEHAQEKWANLTKQTRDLVLDERWHELSQFVAAVPAEYAPQLADAESKRLIASAYEAALKHLDVPLSQILLTLLAHLEPGKSREQDARMAAYVTTMAGLRKDRNAWVEQLRRLVALSARPKTFIEYQDLIYRIDRQLPLLDATQDQELVEQLNQLRAGLVDDVETLRKQEEVRLELDQALDGAQEALIRLDAEGLQTAAAILSGARAPAAAAVLREVPARLGKLEMASHDLAGPVADLERAESWLTDAGRLANGPAASELVEVVHKYAWSAQQLAQKAADGARAAWGKTIGEPIPQFGRPARVKEAAAKLLPSVTPPGTAPQAADSSKIKPPVPEPVKPLVAATKPAKRLTLRWRRGLLVLALVLLGAGLTYVTVMQPRAVESRLADQIRNVGVAVASMARNSEKQVANLSTQINDMRQEQSTQLAALNARGATLGAPAQAVQPAVTSAPAAPAAQATNAPAATTPTPRVQPSPTLAMPDGVVRPAPTIAIEPQTEPRYDAPVLVIKPGENEAPTIDSATKQLQISVKDGRNWAVSAVITSTQGSVPTQTWGGSLAGSDIRFEPLLDQPPLPAGEYTLMLQFVSQPEGWIVDSKPVSITVSAPAVMATLNVAQLRIEPKANLGANLQKPQPIAVNSRVELLYSAVDNTTDPSRLYEFYLVRGLDSRRTGWVMSPETAPAGADPVITLTTGKYADVLPMQK
jgi:hypothetical protein